MRPISEIDQVLAGIAQSLSHESDTLLDLRDAVAFQPHPGRCISCYFALMGAVRTDEVARLTPLRRWLESRIEIAATSADGGLLEVMPLDLEDSPDLETYCRKAMDVFFDDRSYTHTNRIGLNFRFRPVVAA